MKKTRLKTQNLSIKMRRVSFKYNHVTTKKLALCGLFLALALIVALIENMLPPVVPMLPYAKIGLSNIVLLMCFLLIGVWEGFIVLILKCVLAAVFAGNMSALLWSLPSALVAYTIMVSLHATKQFSTTGLSMAGAMLHNFTQILIASIVVGKSVFVYLPYMLFAGGLAGLVTGLVCHILVERFRQVIAIPKLANEIYHRSVLNEEE